MTASVFMKNVSLMNMEKKHKKKAAFDMCIEHGKE